MARAYLASGGVGGFTIPSMIRSGGFDAHQNPRPELILKVNRKTKETAEEKKGTPYDMADLEKIFKDKPEQLENVLSTAPTFVHPQRGCKMWVVEDFNFSDVSKTENSEICMRELSQVDEKAIAAVKKQKTANSIEPLNTAQKGTVEKLLATLKEAETQGKSITDQLLGDKFLMSFIPQVVQEEMQESVSNVVAQVALVAEALQESWTGNFKKVVDESGHVKKKYDAALKKSDVRKSRGRGQAMTRQALSDRPKCGGFDPACLQRTHRQKGA